MTIGADTMTAGCNPGVSVAICCHNSARRLPETLAHLASQEAPNELPWEVIIIDNASTDDTKAVAFALWTTNEIAPLRVVSEPRLGLTYARERAFREASFDFVSFIDDDNWVCRDWIRTVYELMTNHPEIGVCGSINEPVCEVPPPAWFDRVKTILAISPDDSPTGDIRSTGPLVFGAGMTVRQQAWRSLLEKGFAPLAIGRQGTSLTASEDSEICLGLLLTGWHIWRDPRLRLKHFLPAGRLNWRYIRRVYRGSGQSSVMLDGYHFAASERKSSWKRLLRRAWLWHMLYSVSYLLRSPAKSIFALLSQREGDPAIPMLETQLGRVIGYLCNCRTYGAARAQVRYFLRDSMPELNKSPRP